MHGRSRDRPRPSSPGSPLEPRAHMRTEARRAGPGAPRRCGLSATVSRTIPAGRSTTVPIASPRRGPAVTRANERIAGTAIAADRRSACPHGPRGLPGIPEADVYRRRDRRRPCRLSRIRCPGRLSPSFAMRVSSVVGFRPSRSAAPPAAANPPARALEHAANMLPLDVDQLRAAPGGRRDGCGSRIVSRLPVATIMARSTTLRSSRMLPGHEYCCSAARLSLLDRRRSRLPNAFENSSTNRHTSSGMSSARSRSGGTRSGRR